MSRPTPWTHLTIAGFAILFATGCATLDPPAPEGPGSGLEAAAAEARKDDGDKHVRLHSGRAASEPGETVVWIEHEPSDDCPPEATDDGSAPPPKPPRPPLHAGLIAGTGSASGGQFQQSGFAGLEFGLAPMPRVRVDAAVIGIPQRFAASATPLAGLDQPVELAADFTARYYLTPDRTAQSVYPIVGVRFGALTWDYHHEILIDDQWVHDDELDYVAPYGGLGAAVLRTGAFELDANLTGGFRFYDDHAQSGLRNDLFQDAGFVQLVFETTFRF